MGPENNDGTSVPPLESKLCANGCGFFGTAANMNLCSKCYRDFLLKEERAASAKAAMEKTLSIKNNATKQEVEEVAVEYAEVAVAGNGSSSSNAKTTVMVVEAGGGVGEVVKLVNRCCSCRKKVGVLGFKCKCGSVFCVTHRYPENHGCEFDFKGSGREAIAKDNPTVKADKVDRF